MQLVNYRSKKLRTIHNIVKIMSVIFFLYGTLNVWYSNPKNYLIEFFICLVCVAFLIKFHALEKHKLIKGYMLILVNLLMSYEMYVLYSDGTSNASYIWISLIPIISYMLTGRKWGFILSGFYITIAMVIFVGHEFFSHASSAVGVGNFLDVTFLMGSIWFLAHSYEKVNADSEAELLSLATKDSLTKLRNRRMFYHVFEYYQAELVSLVMVDLDWFKTVNDTYGHDAGDCVLKKVAEILQSLEVDDEIFCFRLGGEEFAILLLKKEIKQALDTAQAFQQQLDATVIQFKNFAIEVTASIGIAESSKDESDLAQVIRIADERLYQAKENGRNCIVYV